MLDISAHTGTPSVPDVFIKQASYLDTILDFVEEALPKNYPFSIDITDAEIKVQALEELANRKLLSRTIYNSLHIGVTPEERHTLKTCTPAMAILVAFNPKDKSPDGKIEVLENGAHLLDTGLFGIAKEAGITTTLVDTAALAPGDNSGAAIAAIPVIKEEYGLPTGCAIHNVVEKSSWLHRFNDSKACVDAASNSAISLFGGDFAIFGPIQHAPTVIPLLAWHDILISEYTETYFGITPDDHHPRRKLQQ
jgi:N5-methyltetrahydromethanopterin:coenzyme M methyltransferase subunit H